MADPEYFDVEYVGNPHMAGNLGRVDRFTARIQWQQVVESYEQLGIPVDVLPAVPLLPDLVFTANQALAMPPGILAEEASAVISIMNSARRQAEIPEVVGFFAEAGIHLERMNPNMVPRFEGAGDVIWQPRRALLFGAVGPRSAAEAYTFLAAWTGLPIVALRLCDSRFYHLDTCLSVLNDETAVYYPGAFDEPSRALLQALFTQLVEVTEPEAMRMVCNGHCPDQRHFLVQEGCDRVNAQLEDLGFVVCGLDTSEFLLSGGSVFCMKQHYWI
jgi:N-dimethylarginine dimethylaminohydrolase